MQGKPVITVDGETGGGQILRNGFALAALSQQPLRVVNIRGGRTPPGLRPQHLQGIKVVAELCQGRLEGATSGARECAFWPGTFGAAPVLADTGTAGSCTLLAQLALPCLLFAPPGVVFRGRGGTDVSWSPPFDELVHVLLPLLTHAGVDARLEVVRRGFYPKGGGEVTLTAARTEPEEPLPPLHLLDPGQVVRLEGRAFAAGPRATHEVAEVRGGVDRECKRLFRGVPFEWVPTPQTAFGNAGAVTLVAITSTRCRYGATHFRDAKAPPAAEAGAQVVQALSERATGGSCVDPFTQDQLVIFMALARGRSEVRCGELTEHTQSAITTAEALLPCRFTTEGAGPSLVLRCDGAGLAAPGVFRPAP